MKFSAVVVDDEKLARQRLQKLLQAHPEITVVGQAGTGAEAVRLINDKLPELVFLDVQLPDFDGFEVLRQLAHPPLAIFTTAYNQYALQAFEAAGIDYLLKPVEPATLEKSIAKLTRLTHETPPTDLEVRLERLLNNWTQLTASPQHLQRIAVRVGERILLIEVRNVTHFFAKDKYVFLQTVGGKEYLVDETLAELEEQLDPKKFVRVHRSTIVNVGQIREIQNWFGGKYRLILGTNESVKILVSKGMAGNLKSVVPF